MWCSELALRGHDKMQTQNVDLINLSIDRNLVIFFTEHLSVYTTDQFRH